MTEIENSNAKEMLKRFCYLGSFEPVYVRPRVGINVGEVFPTLNELVKNLKDVEFVAFMSEILNEAEHLPRKDEALFAYATYLASDAEIELKTNVRRAIPLVLRSAEDLFLFCKYSKLIQGLHELKFFSRTTKKAIIEWYERQPPERLREMWMSHRGMHGFTHKHLIHMCHISDSKLGDDKLGTAFFKTCSELVKEDKMKNEKTIQEISTLRTTENKEDAVRIVKDLGLTWDQVPSQLLKHSAIVELLLPRMDLMEIIRKWHVLHQHRHLDNPKVFKLIEMLTNRECLQKANVFPTTLLWRMDRLGIPMDAADLAKVPGKRVLTMCMRYFHQMFNDSFTTAKQVGLRLFITMTLQDNYKKKFITKHKKITYYQAAVSFAFSYFKREKNTDVFAYTDDRVKLTPIPWSKGMKVNQAMEICDRYSYKKSSQRMVQPLMEALSRKDIYDLFVVIVPSAGRSNPGQNSSFLSKFLDKYRETKNKNAKFVIISLLRHKKSMSYSIQRNENILEICGLDSNTANVIDSFAINRFG